MEKKYSLKMEAFGTLDELDSWLGLLRNYLNPDYDIDIVKIQVSIKRIYSNEIEDKDITELEKLIGYFETDVNKRFIIPGINKESSYCHIVRTVCRRAERRLFEYYDSLDSPFDEKSLDYINLLSKYLFLLARDNE